MDAVANLDVIVSKEEDFLDVEKLTAEDLSAYENTGLVDEWKIEENIKECYRLLYNNTSNISYCRDINEIFPLEDNLEGSYDFSKTHDHTYSSPYPYAGAKTKKIPPFGYVDLSIFDDSATTNEASLNKMICNNVTRSICKYESLDDIIHNIIDSNDDDVVTSLWGSSCSEDLSSYQNSSYRTVDTLNGCEGKSNVLKSIFGTSNSCLTAETSITLIQVENPTPSFSNFLSPVQMTPSYMSCVNSSTPTALEDAPFAAFFESENIPLNYTELSDFATIFEEEDNFGKWVSEDEKFTEIYDSEPISSINYIDDLEASFSSIDVETIDYVPSTSKVHSSRTKRKKHKFDHKNKRRSTVQRGNSPITPVKKDRKSNSNAAKENGLPKTRVYQKRNQGKKGGVLQSSPRNNPNSLCNPRDVARPSRMNVHNDDDEVVKKRMNPAGAERMRRQKLKECFENLRCAVPGVCHNPKASQVTILQAAASEASQLREKRKQEKKTNEAGGEESKAHRKTVKIC